MGTDDGQKSYLSKALKHVSIIPNGWWDFCPLPVYIYIPIWRTPTSDKRWFTLNSRKPNSLLKSHSNCKMHILPTKQSFRGPCSSSLGCCCLLGPRSLSWSPWTNQPWYIGFNEISYGKYLRKTMMMPVGSDPHCSSARSPKTSFSRRPDNTQQGGCLLAGGLVRPGIECLPFASDVP